MRQHAHVIDSTLNVKLVELWLSSSGLGLGRCWTRNKSSVLKLGFNELTSMWLLCPRERLRIIVMSVSVSVCLSVRISLEQHTRPLPNFCACCLWPWLGPPPAGWRKPKGKGQFWGFSSHWQGIVQQSIWVSYENRWIDRDAVWDDEWAWPEEQCAMWRWWYVKEKGHFEGKHARQA